MYKKVQQMLLCSAVMSLFFALSAWAGDDATTQVLQTDVHVNKSMTDDNDNKIRNVESGLPAEQQARIAADNALLQAINNMQLTPGQQGQACVGPQEVLDALCQIAANGNHAKICLNFCFTVPAEAANLPIYTYNEGLSTVLRGIQLDATAARKLGLVPRYYKISEHRVSNMPNEWVVALHFYKNYSESANGASVSPQRDEPYVFSIIDQYEYDSSGYRFTGRDFYGHTLSFDIAFQPDCFAVRSASLNCSKPGITAQTFTTEALYTCGVTSEPPWSNLIGQ